MKTPVKKLFIVICGLIRGLTAFEQDTATLKMHGTMIVSAVCKDGAILISDSRTTIAFNSNTFIGYFDSSQKIFAYNQFAIASSGPSGVGGIPFANIFNKIRDSSKNCKTSKCIYDIAYSQAITPFPIATNPELESAMFFLISYIGPKPSFYAFLPKYRFYNEDGFISNQLEFKSFVETFPKVYDSLRTSKYSILRATQIMQQLMRTFIKKYELENQIGGPFSIVSVSSGNKIKWVQNNFKNNIIKNDRDFFEKMIAQKITFHYTMDSGSVILKRYFKTKYNYDWNP